MTTQFTISPEHRSELLKFLKKNPDADAVAGYCAYVEQKYRIKPVVYSRQKKIYKTLDDLMKHLEAEGKFCRETEITIHYGKQSVNDNTKKIVICPFCSNVIGDNMVQNLSDAAYEHVRKCKDNHELVGGVPSKRFSVSEDSDLIATYMTERKAAVKKVVYTSATGKLYNSREAVIDDFKKNQMKPVSFYEVVLNPKEYEIEESLAAFRDDQVVEEKIISFLEGLSKHTEFEPYVKRCQEGE